MFNIIMEAVLSGCATLSPDEQVEINHMAKMITTQLEERNPDLGGKLDLLPGYLVVNMKALKVPIFGGAGGQGVVVERGTGKRTYVKVARVEIGGG